MEMAELPIPTRSAAATKRTTTTQFSNLLIPILVVFSSFILSYPLYFLKLLSFLSPLLITTFLILLFTSHQALLERLKRAPADGVGEKVELELEEGAEENEVYKIFFEASGAPLEDGLQEPEELVDKFLICGDNADAQSEKTLEELFQEKEEGDSGSLASPVVEEKEVKEVEEALAESKNGDLGIKADECGSRAWRNSRRLSNSLKIFDKNGAGLGDEKMGMVLGGFGSMRRTEKEWTRTLACKLFEERHSNNDVEGDGGEGEGMDLLWETYEKSDGSTSMNAKAEDHSKNLVARGRKKFTKKKSELQKQRGDGGHDIDEDEDDEEDEEEEMGGQFCCLQALKLSAGKVNLGMGKPNMAKISKAFRGIGWLHYARSRRGHY